jgi:acetyltransferase-like isoleucine patch superfamily enzyme
MIGWNTTIMDNDGMFTLTSDSKRTIEDKFYVSIENKCWIGCNCTILKGSTLGNGTVIAAHSLVNTLIAPNSLAGGVPARILKSNISWGAFS